MRAGILGVAGYTGAELLRLLAGHDELSVAWVGGKGSAGKALSEVLPGSAGHPPYADLQIEAFEPSQAAHLSEQLDVVFCALPHGASAGAVAALYAAGLTVVDLSADFRFKSAAVYEQWYGPHPHPELLGLAVYGQPETHRADLKGARLIASPGCYPTSAILPVSPLLAEGLIEPAGLVVDSKSGVSGAGRGASQSKLFCEADGSLRAYSVAGQHRHGPEIEQELALAAGAEVRLLFTPQVVPAARGILTTAYARPRPGCTLERALEAARSRYPKGGLVRVLEGGALPDTRTVNGSALATLTYALDERTGLLLCVCAIDNLCRGASGQAVQALNVARGWPERLGLPSVAMFP